MFTSRIRLLAGAGFLSCALVVGSVGGAFAAPAGDPATPVASPVALGTTTPSPTVATSGRVRGERPLLRGFLKEMSQLFGVSRKTLVQQLESGTTLAQLAPQYGKTAADVETTLQNALKARLDKRVAAGKITADQESARLAKAGPRIDKLVNTNLATYVKRLQRQARRHQPKPTAATPTPTS